MFLTKFFLNNTFPKPKIFCNLQFSTCFTPYILSYVISRHFIGVSLNETLFIGKKGVLGFNDPRKESYSKSTPLNIQDDKYKAWGLHYIYVINFRSTFKNIQHIYRQWVRNQQSHLLIQIFGTLRITWDMSCSITNKALPFFSSAYVDNKQMQCFTLSTYKH